MSALKTLSHDQLLSRLHELIQRHHTLEVDLIAYLGEVDTRRLYLQQACPSMFHFCLHVLHFAEGVAYKRIAVARAARRFPQLLLALQKGDLHLTAASLIAPHLDRQCAEEHLAAARHKTAREIKHWIADRNPKDDVATSVRRAPRLALAAGPSKTPASARPTSAEAERQPAADSSAPPPPPEPKPLGMPPSPQQDQARCEPLGAARYFIRFTADETVHQELRSLLRHQIPDGDVAKIVGRAIHTLLEHARKQKIAASASPGSSEARTTASPPAPNDAPAKTPSRHIPAAIRRAVWGRDGGRCTYTSQEGRQCGSRDFLEFHHQVPWARCRDHSLSNIHLRCRSHNQHAAELDFGIEHMAASRKGGTAVPVEGADARGVGSQESLLDVNPVRVGVADGVAP